MSAAFYNYKAVNLLREFISKKILVYNPETGKHEPIDAIRGESAYEIAVRTGQTALPEDEWIKQVQSGQIDGDFVKTVNSLHPDEKGNVKVTVNGQTADENGNIQIDVGGKVQSVNGQSPDPETGNVEIEVGNPDVITTLTRDEFNALTTAQIQKMYEDGVRTILVENEMEEGEGTYTISWDGITDRPNAYPPTEHTHGLSDEVDAAKLGGKPPEYYLALHNLLDNSDFSNGKFIVQAGLNGLHGSTVYLGDRWIGDNRITAEQKQDHIVLTSTSQFAYIVQKAHVEGGKTYTLAIKSTGADCYLGFDVGGAKERHHEGDVYTLQVDVSYDSNLIEVRLYPAFKDGGGTANIYWAGLYEGAFTPKTLPPYVPKGYAGELLACKVADTGGIDADTLGGKAPEYYLSPKNYLDNGYFLNPVNQRGSTELTQSGTYPVDRWRFAHTSGETGKASVSAAGITITKSNEAEYCDLYQRIANPEELVGKQITFAVKFAGYDTPLVLNAPFGNGNYNAHYGDGEIRIFTYDNSKAYIRLRNVGTSMTVEWAALYEGTYLPENLPPYVPKGYAAELAECQRYYIHFGNSDYTWLPVSKIHGWGSVVSIPANLRIAEPSIVKTAPDGIAIFDNAGEWIKTTLFGVYQRGSSVYVVMNNVPNTDGGSSYICKGITGLSADL